MSGKRVGVGSAAGHVYVLRLQSVLCFHTAASQTTCPRREIFVVDSPYVPSTLREQAHPIRILNNVNRI